GNRAHSLGESACARGLLADATARERDGFVEVTSALSADSDLQEDRRCSVKGGVQVGRQNDPTRVSVGLRDVPCGVAYNLQPSRIGVVQHEFVNSHQIPKTGES